MRPWYERYFSADYWAYATAEYTEERTAVEVDYLTSVLAAHAPGRRVLDLGCGIGRHAVALARRGFDVTGVDVSAWALERAAAAARAAGVAVRWHRLDALTTPDWPVPAVDAVVCVQAFGWGSDAQQLRMLRGLRRLLVPGGLLVLDHSNVSAILRMYSSRSVASVGGSTFEFLRRYDPLTGRSGGVVRVRRPSGETVELPDDVRLYQPSEVAGLLTAAGFEVCRADADFRAGAAVGMDTRYVQFVARAPGWPASALAGHAGQVGAQELDLRWAPDEVEFVAGALEAAWRSVAAGQDIRERARRYDVADPYGAQRCTAALARHFGVELAQTQVTAGAGATGLLRSLAGLATGGTVLLDPLGHPELALAGREIGAAVHTARLLEPAAAGPTAAGPTAAGPVATQTAVELVRAARPAVVVLDRPGVVGMAWSLESVRALATVAADGGGVLVVDETCASYLPPAESAMALAASGTRGLVVVRSMSKGYCCGGLRVGFAVSSPELAGQMRAVCAPLAAGALALDVAVALLEQGDVLAGLRTRIAAIRPRFAELLAGAGFEVRPGDPRVPWVTVAATEKPLAVLGIAGKSLPTALGEPELVRLSVPLSEPRWEAATAALEGRR